MNESELRKLLLLPESATLDFKRQAHKIFDNDPDTKKRERSELIKDILSLANGSANSAGEIAYLILGVDDKADENGFHPIFGVDGRLPNSKDIFQIVNPACDPPISDLLCEPIPIDGKTVLVITILPSPHLHETTRRLDIDDKKYYTERTVFIRRDERIDIASARDRAAIQELKTLRLTERRNAPPVLLGLITGSVVGRQVAQAIGNDREMEPNEKVGYELVWTVIGAMLGTLLGRGYIDVMQAVRIVYRYPASWRPAAVIGLIVVSAGSALGINALLQRHKNQILRATAQLGTFSGKLFAALRRYAD